jgi:hypothetical protein
VEVEAAILGTSKILQKLGKLFQNASPEASARRIHSQ